MSEKVLVFPEELIANYDFSKGIIYDRKQLQEITGSILNSGKLFYMDRAKAENDPSHKQLIPYTLIFNKNGIFAYQRTKKGGESRLHGLWSIGVGGHINPHDGESNDNASYWEGLKRELQEEIGLTINYNPMLVAALYDNSNDVGKVHFGMVHGIMVGLDWQPTTKDFALSNGWFEFLHTLMKNKDSFENWSKIILENLYGDTKKTDVP